MLSEIKNILERSGIASVAVNHSDAHNQEHLTCKFYLEDSQTEVSMNIMLLSDVEEELDGLKIMQYFVELPMKLAEIPNEKFATFIHKMMNTNFELPIGSFGHLIENDLVYFQYREMFNPKISVAEIEKKLLVCLDLICWQLEKFIQASDH
ncbi:MAG: hypothetical protein VXX63_01990 [Bacteroidota bacterium]|nr:hypothetical protein [Bacteroidota bacterium]